MIPAPSSLDDLTPRQHNELLSLAGFPPMALDEEAVLDLAGLGLVELTPERGYTTPWYRILPAGRALLPPSQQERLAATEATLVARKEVFAKYGIR